ncbi:MAG: NAD(P)/FAD-dependent oxidoreductase [Planctomycetes bacterium]|nr:NAD(P)/FAD-dependent oxidoreductase [Planctomycetota bacterium]
MKTDVIIVGAGPAGSTLAAFLGARGLRVLLVDKARFPRDKVCGEYMSPQALATLDRSGALPKVERVAHRKLRGVIVAAYDGTRSRGTYRSFGRYAPYRPYGLAIRRLVFDQVLFEHAKSLASVTAIEGFRVEELIREGERVAGVRGCWDAGRAELRAPLTVGADGVRSVVARGLGLSEFAADHQKYALAAYWRDMEHEDYGELHMGFPGYFALAPVEENLVNVNFVVDRKDIDAARGDAASFYVSHLRSNPRLSERMRRATRVGPVRATGPMARRCKGPVAPGAMLIGDAAEFVDPFTGEGLFSAIRSAEVAAGVIELALADGELKDEVLNGFARLQAEEFGEKVRACWTLQRYLYRPRVANFIVRRMAANGALADKLTALSGDYVPLAAAVKLSVVMSFVNSFGKAACH